MFELFVTVRPFIAALIGAVIALLFWRSCYTAKRQDWGCYQQSWSAAAREEYKRLTKIYRYSAMILFLYMAGLWIPFSFYCALFLTPCFMFVHWPTPKKTEEEIALPSTGG
jgi:hypothetical protein